MTPLTNAEIDDIQREGLSGVPRTFSAHASLGQPGSPRGTLIRQLRHNRRSMLNWKGSALKAQAQVRQLIAALAARG